MNTRRGPLLVGLIVAWQAYGAQADLAADGWLTQQLRAESQRWWVYADADDGRNHFYPTSYEHDPTGQQGKLDLTVDSACVERPHSGATCLRVVWARDAKVKTATPWVSLQWYNRPVWAAVDGQVDAGPPISLVGAKRLVAWMRAKPEGLRVALCVGARDPIRKRSPRLDGQWRQVAIDLTGADLSAVTNGFGLVIRADDVSQNSQSTCTIDIDDVEYEGLAAGPGHLLRSYGSHPTLAGSPEQCSTRNVSWIYDVALMILERLSSGRSDDLADARQLADTLLYCQQHDRQGDRYSGAMRNAYMTRPYQQQGEAARLPGWWLPGAQDQDGAREGRWLEDCGQAGITVGNLAWAMIALLHLDRHAQPDDHRYRNAALKVGAWIDANCRIADGPGGYHGGLAYDLAGLSEREQAEEHLCLKPVKWRSTEHAVDLVVAYTLAHRTTGDERWRDRALHAARFVGQMWVGDHFATGTDDQGGHTPRPTPQPLDVGGPWPLLVFGANSRTRTGMAWAQHECEHDGSGGYDFDTDRDGYWAEGTGQMAVAYAAMGDQVRYDRALLALATLRGPDGGTMAASRDGLTTGFDLTYWGSHGTKVTTPWLYYRQASVAASCWHVFGARAYNPYWDTPAVASAGLDKEILQAACGR